MELVPAIVDVSPEGEARVEVRNFGARPAAVSLKVSDPRVRLGPCPEKIGENAGCEVGITVDAAGLKGRCKRQVP